MLLVLSLLQLCLQDGLHFRRTADILDQINELFNQEVRLNHLGHGCILSQFTVALFVGCWCGHEVAFLNRQPFVKDNFSDEVVQEILVELLVGATGAVGRVDITLGHMFAPIINFDKSESCKDVSLDNIIHLIDKLR